MSLHETPMLLRYRERVGAERYGIEVEIDDPHSTRAGEIRPPSTYAVLLTPGPIESDGALRRCRR
jgi:hypothetical protein